MPWRIAAVDANMGGRFAVTRHYSPFSATNNRQQITSWFKLKREICMNVRQMNQPNPISMVIGVAAAATSAGGAVGGCLAWQPCKEAAATRCWQYGTFAIVGILTMIFQFISAVCSGVVPVCMSQEQGIKKKKDKEEALFKTQVVTIIAFVMDFIGVMMYIGVTEMGFRTLKQGSYYPWPAMFIGSFVALFGILLTLLAMVAGIMRTKPPKENEEATEETDQQQPDANQYDMNMPPPMMGGMPPYDPSLGPPPPFMGMDPGMGPPPMGGMGPPPPMGGMPPPGY